MSKFEVGDVPDVDGNPIRVGQLVAHPPTGRVRRAAAIYPEGALDDGPVVEIEESFGPVDLLRSSALRVLTADDLHRPPTEDVTLRVVISMVPDEAEDGPADQWVEVIRAEVAKHLFDEKRVTVEVIEDGDGRWLPTSTN